MAGLVGSVSSIKSLIQYHKDRAIYYDDYPTDKQQFLEITSNLEAELAELEESLGRASDELREIAPSLSELANDF